MANCVFPGCGVQRISKYEGIGLFKITSRQGDFYAEWRNKTIDVISSYRVVDKDLKRRMDEGKVFICERHFLPEEIELTSKFLIFIY